MTKTVWRGTVALLVSLSLAAPAFAQGTPGGKAAAPAQTAAPPGQPRGPGEPPGEAGPPWGGEPCPPPPRGPPSLFFRRQRWTPRGRCSWRVAGAGALQLE